MKKHIVGKEKHLPKLHFWVPAVSFQGAEKGDLFNAKKESSSQEVRNESDDDEESVRDKLLHVFHSFSAMPRVFLFETCVLS